MWKVIFIMAKENITLSNLQINDTKNYIMA